eukprot:scaffold3504_cov95-Isochrysis_galbana.AAC.1
MREWTSAEASPYWPKTRARTLPRARRVPRTAVVEPPLCRRTAGSASRWRASCAGSRCRRSGHAVQQPRSGRWSQIVLLS